MSTKPQDKKPATGSAAQDRPKTDAPKDKKPAESKDAPRPQADKPAADKKPKADDKPRTEGQPRTDEKPRTETKDGEKRDQKQPREAREDRRDQKPSQAKEGEQRDRDQKPREGTQQGEKKDREPRQPREGDKARDGERGERAPRDRKPREDSEYQEKGSKPRTERKPREGKEGEGERRETGDKGGDRNRGDRDKRPRTEGGDKPDRPKRERKEKPKREWDPNWRDKITVTLDTVIEKAPEPVPKPDKEKLEKDLKFCDDKVEEYKKQLEILFKKRDDWRKKQRDDKEKERLARHAEWDKQDKEREDHKQLFEDKKKVLADFNVVNKKKKEIDAELEAVNQKITELEKKFPTKSIMSSGDVMEQIRHLEDRQMNEKLTGNEEKKIIAEIYALKKSLPSSSEATVFFDQKKEILSRRREVIKELEPHAKKLKIFNEQIDTIKAAREAKEAKEGKIDTKGGKGKKEGEEGAKDKDAERPPKDTRTWKEKRDAGEVVDDSPFAKDIDQFFKYKSEMFAKKEKLRDEFDAAWDKYHEVKEKIMKIDWIRKQQEHLKNVETIKEEKARRERKALIQEYIEKNTPKEDATAAFGEELAACEVLSSYLVSILPANRRLMAKEDIKKEIYMSEAEIKDKIAQNKAYAGLKVMVKEPLNTEPAGKKKKVGDKKKDEPKKEEKKPEEVEPEENYDDPEQKLVLDLMIRNAFSQIKVEPPVANKDIETAIKQVEAKKTELDEHVKRKEEEIAAIKKNAEAEVPSLEELKLKYKDIPRDRDEEKGTHGHKDRRGARGGRYQAAGERSDGTNRQWHGKRDAHPPREGDEERANEQDRQDEDSVEIDRRRREKEANERRKVKNPSSLTAADFPTL